MMRVARRALVLGAAGLVSSPARAEESTAEPFEVLQMAVPVEGKKPRRSLVLVPRGAREGARLPILVLLHGLGETRSEALGVEAWLKPYGLGAAWSRLITPPLMQQAEPYWAEAELSAFNSALARVAFQGMVVVCPYLPNPQDTASAAYALSRYAHWLSNELLPAVRERVKSTSAHSICAIAGVSLGGYAALEVFLSNPTVFAGVGSIQGAYSVLMAKNYARRIAKAVRTRPAVTQIYVASSTSDPYRTANEQLCRDLRAAGVPARWSLRRGPHSQAWLREVGALEVLAFYDRALRGQADLAELGPP